MTVVSHCFVEVFPFLVDFSEFKMHRNAPNEFHAYNILIRHKDDDTLIFVGAAGAKRTQRSLDVSWQNLEILFAV